MSSWRTRLGCWPSPLEGTFDHIATRAFVLDQMFLQYPEVRPYFYERESLPDEDNVLRHRIIAAAETMLDVFGVIVLHRERFAEGLVEQHVGRVHAPRLRSKPISLLVFA